MTSSRRPQFLARTEWTSEQLDADRRLAQEEFRLERMQESLQAYLDVFEGAQGAMRDLLARSDDLARLEDQALSVLTDAALLDCCRYLVSPPISVDDLKTLADTNSIAPQELRKNPDLVQRLVDTVRTGLDRARFPWVFEGRGATQAERIAAILASASLMATQRVATSRRTESKRVQEERVRQALLRHGLTEIRVPGRQIQTLAVAPQPGEFCREVRLGSRKADLVVGLLDRRIMPIECKVSNSSINSVKRLNNDAAVKAEVWQHDFGARQVVPVAVLSGVYKLHNLEEAQIRGLTIYWAHRLQDLVEWIEQTRSVPPSVGHDGGS